VSGPGLLGGVGGWGQVAVQGSVGSGRLCRQGSQEQTAAKRLGGLGRLGSWAPLTTEKAVPGNCCLSGHASTSLNAGSIAALPSCRDHVLENRGIAASTAFMYATCLQHHVPEVGAQSQATSLPAGACSAGLPSAS